MNPMLLMLAKGMSSSPQMQGNNPMQLLQQFSQFRQQMQGKDPEAMVNELLKSGKMSQAQFEQLKQQAQGLQSFLK